MIKCAHAGCQEKIGNSKFAKIRAGEVGWFFSRVEEKAYCPAHIPVWVKAWRARKKERR